ncbi:prephenate dehydratase [Methanocella arvoryzae]|uniref:prephenate dehydratase n=1 Tax=Methanocella arvoryzae (strain DSM 22066 / NBRC 105507 / MRE50) TaxID=351160 RepID=Q0W0C5_METAR|nr:prephenate dehydratase [Methanocella arvoryzae]CAJ38168.1 putative prephenate dehydratase [Methanocella arvoryzae MRE50]
MRLGLLGPEGTFSEMAAKKWRKDAELVFFDDMELAAMAVDEGRVDESIVAIENSVEGPVGVIHDRLLDVKSPIVGEVVIPIRQCLMARPDASEIKVILSHPQGLGQCRKYIREHYPNAEIRSTGSTAHAARLAQEFPEMAAIGCSASAEKYHLKVLAEGIQDRTANYTRFLVIGKNLPAPTGQDKTSLAVYLDRDRPGALYEFLGEFATRGINMTRIESRPSKLTLGDYRFFIDVEGHCQDKVLGEALHALKDRTSKLKVLGSYPVADKV